MSRGWTRVAPRLGPIVSAATFALIVSEMAARGVNVLHLQIRPENPTSKRLW